MAEPTMTLPNGDVLRDGDWGLTREGNALQVRICPNSGSGYDWLAGGNGYTEFGCFHDPWAAKLDIIARATAPSTRPADEMDLTALCKPFGMLHEETKAALKAWPYGIETFCLNAWREDNDPSWIGAFTYRAKPVPTIAAEVQAFADMHNAAKKAGLIT